MIETNVGAQRAWQVQTAPHGTAAHAALGGDHAGFWAFRCFHNGVLPVDAWWAKRGIQAHLGETEAFEKTLSPGFGHGAAR